MRCPKCNFENRPDARFCKRCGQPLAATPAPPAQVAVCPACGVTAKPGARFCPRCGQPLPATPPAQPQGYAQPPAQPPAPAQSQGYAQPPAVPPPPTAQPPQKRKLPRWALWAGIAAAVLLCIIAVVVVGPKIFGAEKEPVASLTPVETPTVEATADETPTTAAPTATPLPDTPTPLPPPTPTDAPLPTATPAPVFDAQVTIAFSALQLRTDDLLTITVTITNTGNVPFGLLRFQLLEEWSPYLNLLTEDVVDHDANVDPGAPVTATFVLKAIQPGPATLKANVTMETRTDPPRTERQSSDPVTITITAQ